MKTCSSYLLHILDETEFLLANTAGLSFSQFTASPVLMRAVVRSLEIIGEAVKNLPDDFKTDHPQVEWRKIAGTRDRLIHGYFSVDFELVWDIVRNKIPALDRDVKDILQNMPK